MIVPDYIDVSEKILEEIENKDCSQEIKKFLRKAFMIELRREPGESFKSEYKRELENVRNFDDRGK